MQAKFYNCVDELFSYIVSHLYSERNKVEKEKLLFEFYPPNSRIASNRVSCNKSIFLSRRASLVLHKKTSVVAKPSVRVGEIFVSNLFVLLEVG